MRVLSRRRWVAVLAACSALLLASAVLGLVSGPSGLALSDVLDALRGETSDAAASDIVLRIRLPRVVLACLVGAALAVAGVCFQALLRNPLADPYILGVSGGAALAVLALGRITGTDAFRQLVSALLGGHVPAESQLLNALRAGQ